MTKTKRSAGFHHGADKGGHAEHGHHPGQIDVITYTFESFYHPFVGDLIARLNRTSVAGMLDPTFLHGLSDEHFFRAAYHPQESASVHVHAGPKEIDVAPGGAYSDYNWELLYHVPVAIAVHLSKNQRFAEAQKWFHFVFDPTATGPGSRAGHRAGDSHSSTRPGSHPGQRAGDSHSAPAPAPHAALHAPEAHAAPRAIPHSGLPAPGAHAAASPAPHAAPPAPEAHAAASPGPHPGHRGDEGRTASGPGPAAERCWKFLGFRGEHATSIDALLMLLGTPDAELTPEQIKRKEWVHQSYEAILSSPFRPHLVARSRPLAYQYYVVMKYLDNLIAWGDSLFARYTIETINEAMVSYVLAANLLGPRPQRIPSQGKVAPKSFAQLKKAGFDELGKALVDLEGRLPLNSALPSPGRGGASHDDNGPLFGIGRSLYFCVPRNEKLLAYWDTVADRLFKIRNCMDITGVVRPLPLFDPPLDPGMLIKATAAGLDISGILAGLSQPIGPLRALPQIQKALEICSEVKALGGALLSAWEKGDGEQMALLRQGHEIEMQQRVQDVRFLQWKQAEGATESLLKSRATTLERYRYCLRLLGQTPDAAASDKLPLDRRELTEDNFDDAFGALVGQYEQHVGLQSFPAIKWAGGNAPSKGAGASGAGQLYLSESEDSELSKLRIAQGLRISALAPKGLALSFVPVPKDATVNFHFWGVGGSLKQPVGQALINASQFAADVLETSATCTQEEAGMAGKTASYERRADEWRLQANSAAHELMAVGRQILSSLIAEQVARHEYENAKAQVQHAQDVDHHLRSKFTSAELYGWMQGEVSRIYYQYYRFALDAARKAEQTMKRELMRPELDGTTFVQLNHWNAGQKGLLSGEALHLDLKRLEMAYHDNNKRELELTRHVSLRQLDPMALLQLKMTGACTVSIPEWLYDRDCPGHYMRRIKTVALSIPSVVGPYTSVNCTLTLQKSTVRVSPRLANGSYARDTEEQDDRFVDYLGSVDSVVTSTGTNDSGMFETNLRDERFLPFEGTGAVGTWGLALPAAMQGFDYMTISDVILHVRYTARNGGAALGARVTKELQEALGEAGQVGLALVFSLRHDFPTEWAAFLKGTGNLAVTLKKSYFPYMVQGGPVSIDGLVLLGEAAGRPVQVTVAVPEGLEETLSGMSGAGVVAVDSQVLRRDASAQAFLIVQYHLGG